MDTMTVKELIEELNKISPDTPIVIRDADTDWYLNIDETYIDIKEGILVLRGCYSNEYPKRG